jgi:hypothetical protein
MCRLNPQLSPTYAGDQVRAGGHGSVVDCWRHAYRVPRRRPESAAREQTALQLIYEDRIADCERRSNE